MVGHASVCMSVWQFRAAFPNGAHEYLSEWLSLPESRRQEHLSERIFTVAAMAPFLDVRVRV